MQKVYVVIVKNKVWNDYKLSQESYFSLTKAQRFIEGRSDIPEKLTEYLYESPGRFYEIHELTIR